MPCPPGYFQLNAQGTCAKMVASTPTFGTGQNPGSPNPYLASTCPEGQIWFQQTGNTIGRCIPSLQALQDQQKYEAIGAANLAAAQAAATDRAVLNANTSIGASGGRTAGGSGGIKPIWIFAAAIGAVSLLIGAKLILRRKS